RLLLAGAYLAQPAVHVVHIERDRAAAGLWIALEEGRLGVTPGVDRVVGQHDRVVEPTAATFAERVVVLRGPFVPEAVNQEATGLGLAPADAALPGIGLGDDALRTVPVVAEGMEALGLGLPDVRQHLTWILRRHVERIIDEGLDKVESCFVFAPGKGPCRAAAAGNFLGTGLHQLEPMPEQGRLPLPRAKGDRAGQVARGDRATAVSAEALLEHPAIFARDGR